MSKEYYRSHMPKILLLLSGGLDSICLSHWYRIVTNFPFECIHFNYGSNHRSQERRQAELHCDIYEKQLHKIVLPTLSGSQLTDGTGSWVVPGRNSILLSVASNFAEANGFDLIAYGCNEDDAEDFPDCRPEWVGAFNSQLKRSGMDCRVVTPFINQSKKKIVDWARGAGVPFEDSWSCYNDGTAPCGSCPACVKRTEATKA